MTGWLRLRLALALALLTVVAASCGGGRGAPRTSPPAFDDDFSTGRLDPGRWTTCYPWWPDPARGCTNQGNHELEWYLPSQVTVSGGMLHLTATQQPITQTLDGRQVAFPYRSGMVATARHFAFEYGRVAIRARAPAGAGLWPTLWLLPASQRWPPEIDLMEAYGNFPHLTFLTYHRAVGDAPQKYMPLDITAWHDYELDWSPDALRWYIDGSLQFTVTGGVPNVPMYVVANLAVSGDPRHTTDASTPSSASFDISRVRVWTR